MKKFLILGSGLMSRAIVEDLIKQKDVSEVIINDINIKRIKENISWLKSIKADVEKIKTENIDVNEKKQLTNFIKKEHIDIIINALPHTLSVTALEAAIETGTNAVDLVFENDQLKLNEPAKKAGITIIPGCGVDPGLTNMLAGYGVSMLDKIKGIYIKCGGIPQKPLPPLEYRILFNLESVWLEYTRPVKIIKNGKLVIEEPLNGIETIELPEIGKLECFYTDGISTLPLTFKEAQEIEAKTIRYPGHAMKIKVLKECGLLDNTPLEIKGIKTTPREILTELLTPKLTLKDEKDVTIVIVDVIGTKNNDEIQYTFKLIDYYDEKKNITSMARTTGYTASIIAQLLAKEKIKDKGIIPPEKLGLNKILFEEILTELNKRNLNITMTTKYTKKIS